MASPPEVPTRRGVPDALIAGPWRLARFLGAVAALMIAALVLLAVAEPLGQRLGLRLGPAAPQGGGGMIALESREIYTRERLLNDRLDHAAWLDRLLARMGDPGPPESFRSVDLRREAALLRSLGNTSEAAEIQAAAAAGTTRDLFEAMNEYREALRMERLQLLLDDRHDREGNTLHLLSFDTTVLRAPAEQRFGLVLLRLRSPRALDQPGENGVVATAAAEFRDILAEWRGHVQETLDSAVRAQAAAIGHALGPGDATLLSRLSALRLCAAIFPRDDALCRAVAERYGEALPAGEEGETPRSLGPLAFAFDAWWNRAVEETWSRLMAQLEADLGQTRRAVQAALRSWGIPADAEAAGPNAQQTWVEGLFEACGLRPLNPYAPVTERELAQIEARPHRARDGGGAEAVGAVHLRPPALPCPPTRPQLALAAAEAMLARFDRAIVDRVAQALRVMAGQAGGGPAVMQQASQTLGDVIGECLRLGPVPGSIADAASQCVGGQMLSTRRHDHEQASRCGAAHLQKARIERSLADTTRLAEGEREAVAALLGLRVVTLASEPWCRLVLAPVATQAETAEAARALWRALNRDVDVFAYALAPRRHERSDTSDVAVERIAAGVEGGLAGLLGSLGVSETRRSASALREGRALVAGFGMPERPRAAGTPAPNEAVFGWFLGANSAAGGEGAAARAAQASGDGFRPVLVADRDAREPRLLGRGGGARPWAVGGAGRRPGNPAVACRRGERRGMRAAGRHRVPARHRA